MRRTRPHRRRDPVSQAIAHIVNLEIRLAVIEYLHDDDMVKPAEANPEDGREARGELLTFSSWASLHWRRL